MENKKMNYRPNVAAIVLSPLYPFDCKILLAQRSDIKDAWQFPQGGIDKGETPKAALYRELKEEIGTNDIEIIAEYPKWLSYDFPQKVAKKMKPYDGQIQKYFLVRLKSNARINVFTDDQEFDMYKFVSINDIVKEANHFKKKVYDMVLKYFKKEGYL
ncbi:RNA pyrophosphohydrolase [Campylobacter blaseri]|uniref:RNA pyrophosphohydrolase n=1 Tax=Campylobacter blaseri TaxID=2042961 RepID=A0A2P8R224_9BACT|nr:RNA pyrophosphohydrolase [Campylobacter blaseri]PSM52543.1 RNA pyrophosphohydrolase [Campylobacter blaseri]PSM54191.1 RNA pyrophosphohydrolase [Campylobacter blaseri]QKF85842.1 RNA pyrophosphohydrolase [Campylobacter blaseri]